MLSSIVDELCSEALYRLDESYSFHKYLSGFRSCQDLGCEIGSEHTVLDTQLWPLTMDPRIRIRGGKIDMDNQYPEFE